MIESSPVPTGPSEWEKRQAAIKKAIAAAAKKAPTEILKSRAKELDTEAKKEVQMQCEMARMLFHEGMEMYESGDLTFDAFVDDLTRSLKAISNTKVKGTAPIPADDGED